MPSPSAVSAAPANGTPSRGAAASGQRGASVRNGTVALEQVGRTFPTAQGPHAVLRGVDLELSAGEIVAVIGPSGCGKSTLLRLLGGLDAATSGRITVDGTAVRDTDDRTAVAFQEPRLLPWRTVAQNVALGLRRGGDRRAVDARVAELLDLVGLEAAATRRPREVSGGMAQRASLARALARDPEVLLLDEPFGALDALTRLRMQDLLLEVHTARPTTIVLVTHDVEEALYLADRVVLLRTLDDTAASSVVSVTDVPGARPRDRAAHDFTRLRSELLAGLGVTPSHPRPQENR